MESTSIEKAVQPPDFTQISHNGEISDYARAYYDFCNSEIAQGGRVNVIVDIDYVTDENRRYATDVYVSGERVARVLFPFGNESTEISYNGTIEKCADLKEAIIKVDEMVGMLWHLKKLDNDTISTLDHRVPD